MENCEITDMNLQTPSCDDEVLIFPIATTVDCDGNEVRQPPYRTTIANLLAACAEADTDTDTVLSAPTITNNPDGSITYVFDLLNAIDGSVITPAYSTITTQPDTDTVLSQATVTTDVNGNTVYTFDLLNATDGSVITPAYQTIIIPQNTFTNLVDNGDDTYTFTNVDGTTITFDTNSNELVDNGDGTYSWVNGTAVIFTIPAPTFSSVEDLNPTGNTIATHNDGNGNVTNINETITSFVDNGNGSFTYINELGQQVGFCFDVSSPCSMIEVENGCFTIKKPRKVCNDLEGCFPVSPIQPDPTSVALLQAPYIPTDSIEERYYGGTWEWTWDCEIQSFVRGCLTPTMDSKHWCTPRINSLLPAMPFPEQPSDILVNTNNEIDVNGSEVMVTCPVTGESKPLSEVQFKAGDVLKFTFPDGKIEYIMSADCTTFAVCEVIKIVDPAIRIAGLDCCPDPNTVMLSNIQFDPTIHYFVVYELAPNGDVIQFAVETPADNAPKVTLASVSFANPLSDNSRIYAVIVNQADAFDPTTGQPLNPNPTTNILTESSVFFDRYEVVELVDGTDEIPIDCLDGELEFNCVFLAPDGTAITNQAELDAWITSSPTWSFGTRCDCGSYCGINFIGSPVGNLPLVCVTPFVRMGTEEPECPSLKVKSGTYNNGLLEVNSTPQVSEAGAFQQTIEVSTNGGSTWIPTNTFNPSNAFFAMNPNEVVTAEFPVTAQAGMLIRNGVRVIGTTDLFYDTKILPDPLVTVTGGTVDFINQVAETNNCYIGQEFLVTMNEYDNSGVIVQSFTFPAYDPDNATLDVTGSPILLTVVNGNQITFDDSMYNLEFNLQITHNYSCSTDLTTSLTWSDCSHQEYIPRLDNGTSLAVSDSDVGQTDYILSLYDSSGNLVIEYGAGSLYDPTIHYSTNSGSYYPLLGGDYYPVLTLTDGSTILLDPFCIEVWDICSNSVNLNYDGLVRNSGQIYQLPVPTDLEVLQTQFRTLTIADQLIVRDCVGAVIYDSGLVSSFSVISVETPTTGFDLSCGFVEVEIIPDLSQPGGTITIYEASVGCCTATADCDVPKRDPFIAEIPNVNSCTKILTMVYPFRGVGTTSSTGCRTTTLSDFEGEGCLEPFSNISGSARRIQIGVRETSFSNSGCKDIGLRQWRTVTRTGNNVCIQLQDATSFNMLQAFLNLANTDIVANGNEVFYIAAGVGANRSVDVLCGDDGNRVTSLDFAWDYSLITFDSVTNEICFNYDTFYKEDIQADPCLTTIVDATTAADSVEAFFNSNVASFRFGVRYLGVKEPTLSASVQQDGNIYYIERTIGIDQSLCTNQNPPILYTMVLDAVTGEYWLVEGSYTDFQANTARIIQDNTTLVFGNGTGGMCGSNRNWVSFENQDGFIVEDVDFTTMTFDLTYYGGDASENFADLQDFADRMTILTSIVFTPASHNTIVASSGNVNFENVIIN